MYLTCLLCQTKQNNNNKNKRDRNTNSQTETDRQTGKQTDRQTHSADRQTRRQKHAGERGGITLAGAATSIILVATNTLSRQNMSFVATKVCLSQQNFCHDKYLSRQTQLCRDKSFVPTSILLSQQNFCRDKNDTCGNSRQ